MHHCRNYLCRAPAMRLLSRLSRASARLSAQNRAQIDIIHNDKHFLECLLLGSHKFIFVQLKRSLTIFTSLSMHCNNVNQSAVSIMFARASLAMFTFCDISFAYDGAEAGASSLCPCSIVHRRIALVAICCCGEALMLFRGGEYASYDEES